MAVRLIPPKIDLSQSILDPGEIPGRGAGGGGGEGHLDHPSGCHYGLQFAPAGLMSRPRPKKTAFCRTAN